MKAFLNDKEVKKKYLARVAAHAKADEIVKGKYWEDGKGYSDNHAAYEQELGIPEWLAKVKDKIFEGMPNKDAQKWPEQFLKAINVGADLEQIKVPFIVFILESSLKSMKALKFNTKKFSEIKVVREKCEVAVKEMIRCHKLGLDLKAARSAANSAAYSAAYSARSVAYSADSAAYSAYSAANSADAAADSVAYSAAYSVYSAAKSAADSAADSAYSVAYSAYSAADSAANSSRSAAYSVYSAANSAAYLQFSKELLRLLRACKPTTKNKGKNNMRAEGGASETSINKSEGKE